MSFQIHLQGSGLNLVARIKDEALNDVIRLLQEHRDDSGGPPMWPGMGPPRHARPRWAGEDGPPPPPFPGGPPGPPRAFMSPEQSREARIAREKAATPEEKAARQKLAVMDAPPLSQQPGLTFAEKLLLLGAWTEAKKEKFILRGSALTEAFVKAGETPPANPKRDVMAAVQSGWITLGLFPNPNRATLTPSGWSRVLEALG